jgi:hypothetical protein
VLDGDQLALQYLTKLTGAVANHVNSVVHINAAANMERARGGNLSIKLTMQHPMSEAIQHQKDVCPQSFGVMGSTSGGKGPTPMDLDVIKTTAAPESAGDESETMRTIEPNLMAELNVFRTELRGRRTSSRDEKISTKHRNRSSVTTVEEQTTWHAIV